MLDFITDNNQLLTILTVTLGGIFALVKWLDTRNNELREAKYNKYMSLIGVIAGIREDGGQARLTEQIAATWFLMEYKEYREITRKIFSNSNFEDMANQPWITHVLPHIHKMLAEISAPSAPLR